MMKCTLFLNWLCIGCITVTTLWGCGGAVNTKNTAKPKSKQTTTHQKQSKQLRDDPSDQDIANHTRAVTLKRQGAWSLTSEKVQDVASLVAEYAEKHNLSRDLVYGIIWVESRFNPKAKSPVGARGLMQLMPRTAKYLAECIDWSGRASSYNPEFNIAAGTYYIARLIKEFNGNEDLALAAYNAGPTKVRRWLADEGLPKVSIEYATMVQTARSFFGKRAKQPTEQQPAIPQPVEKVAPRTEVAKAKQPETSPTITNEDLDRLGLTILIAGLSDKQFGLEREDDPKPFD